MSRSGPKDDAASLDKRDDGRPRSRRRRLSLESLFQEALRRVATVGLSGVVLTEEALRRAFNDVIPKDWVTFAASQSEQVRRELLDRTASEFGAWLRSIDAEKMQSAVLRTLLEDYDFTLKLEISARPRSSSNVGSSLQFLPRRR